MKKILCAVAVATLTAISLAQAAPSIKSVSNDLAGYFEATGQVGMINAAVPAVMPDVTATPVSWDWEDIFGGDRRRRRDRDRDRGRGRETTRMVSCYSHAGGTERCDTGLSDIWNISVHQISRARCRRYDTWGLDGSVIWVSDGCRADFTVTGLN